MSTATGREHERFEITNFTDLQGNPDGGQAHGPGLCIAFQRGPLQIGEERREPNGCFVETLISVAIARLTYYQSTKFNCSHNAQALDHLNMALGALHARTAERQERQVEGTHQV